jgi:hypothetical protein
MLWLFGRRFVLERGRAAGSRLIAGRLLLSEERELWGLISRLV